MKTWIIRFATLLVFNLLVLIAIVLFIPSVHGTWALLWAAVVLTAATLWLKPLLNRFATSQAQSRTTGMSPAKAKAFTYLLVFAVAIVIWILVVWFTGVRVTGWFWGYALPPIVLLLAWALYDVVDDKLEAQAGKLYDRFSDRNPPAAA